MHQIFGVGTERNSFANGQVGGSNGFNHDLLWSSWVCPTKIRLINDSQRLFAFCIFGGSAVKYDSPGGWICNLFRRPQETYSISSSMFSLLYARWSFLYHFLCGGTYFWVRLGYVSIWKSHENGKKFKDKRETNWTRFGWISSFFGGGYERRFSQISFYSQIYWCKSEEAVLIAVLQMVLNLTNKEGKWDEWREFIFSEPEEKKHCKHFLFVVSVASNHIINKVQQVYDQNCCKSVWK